MFSNGTEETSDVPFPVSYLALGETRRKIILYCSTWDLEIHKQKVIQDSHGVLHGF